MTIAFYRSAGGGKWRLLNGLYRAMFGGALVDVEPGAVAITSRIDGSDDGGRLMVELTTESFAELAQAMLDADPEIATKAFGKALAMGPRRAVFDEDGRELG